MADCVFHAPSVMGGQNRGGVDAVEGGPADPYRVEMACGPDERAVEIEQAGFITGEHDIRSGSKTFRHVRARSCNPATRF